jgi:hypothetical protein
MIDRHLVEAVQKQNCILFIGAGVSRTLDLPDWSGLIARAGEELGFDADLFRLLGDSLALAEFYAIERRGIGELRSRLDREWNDARIDVTASRAHRLIPELDAPLVYTTNYDNLLERAYEILKIPYSKVVTIADIKTVRQQHAQIVKFHGDFSNDDSIVLTETSYFKRLDFETPLDIKLRAEALGRTILFLGYSLTDINMRLLMYRLQQLWRSADLGDAQPKSFLVMGSPNRVQEAVLRERGVVPIVPENDDPAEGLVAFLEELVHVARGKRVPPTWDPRP